MAKEEGVLTMDSFFYFIRENYKLYYERKNGMWSVKTLKRELLGIVAGSKDWQLAHDKITTFVFLVLLFFSGMIDIREIYKAFNGEKRSYMMGWQL